MANANRRGAFRTSAGHDCDSEFERLVLEDLIKNKVEFEYEPQPPIQYHTRVSNGYCGACASRVVRQGRSYTPDLRLANGVYVEIKGKLTPQNRTLLRAVVKCNPDIDLRFLFQRNNPWGDKAIGKRYTSFADEVGCISSVGNSVPGVWYSERPLDRGQRTRLTKVKKRAKPNLDNGDQTRCCYADSESSPAPDHLSAKGSRARTKSAKGATASGKSRRVRPSSTKSRTKRSPKGAVVCGVKD